MSVSVTTAEGHVVVVQVFSKGEEPSNLQPKADSEPPSRSPKDANPYPLAHLTPLGVVQILTGLLTVFLGIILLLSGPVLMMVPLWTGVAYIVSGALSASVTANRSNLTCLLKGTLAMNIVCCLTAVSGATFSCISLATFVSSNCGNKPEKNSSYYKIPYYNCLNMRWLYQVSMYGINGLLLVLAVLVFCVAVMSSIFTNKVIRRGSSNMQTELPVPVAADAVRSDGPVLLGDELNCPPLPYKA